MLVLRRGGVMKDDMEDLVVQVWGIFPPARVAVLSRSGARIDDSILRHLLAHIANNLEPPIMGEPMGRHLQQRMVTACWEELQSLFGEDLLVFTPERQWRLAGAAS